MKKQLLFLCFALTACYASAQEWSPVNLTDKYNYRLDNDPVITQTTWQTNFSVNGSDTTFFFNKTFCDTCVTIYGGPIWCDTCYAQRNLPRFFGYTVLKTAGGICNFRDPGSRMIELFAQLNDTWLFDTLNNITAQVIFSGTGNVLSNSDSVKTLLLSSGDTVQFSKNYGVTIWPNGYGQNSYYRLAGIHGRNIGELVPRTNEYFDFNVGDMFEYESHYQACNASPVIHSVIRKYTITSATVNGDTIMYHVTGNAKDHYSNNNPWNPYSGTSHFLFSYDIYVVDSAGHVGNLFNGEMVGSEGRTMSTACSGLGDYTGPSFPVTGISLAGTYLFKDSIGIDAIGLGVDGDISYYGLETTLFDAFQVYSQSGDTLIPYLVSFTSTSIVVLKKGLGQVSGLFEDFESYYSEHLTAYRKGNDTVGVFTTDDVLNGISAANETAAINVYPNPSSGTMTVELPVNANTDIHITDLQGRVVKTFTHLGGQTAIHAGDLADGTYLLQISSAEGNTQQKIVIKH
jgi:hypothetical protein